MIGHLQFLSPQNSPFWGQIALIVIVTRGLDQVLSKEIGGIILGPSVLGHIPGFKATIFPDESFSHLTLIANIELLLYLFLVGLQLDPQTGIEAGEKVR